MTLCIDIGNTRIKAGIFQHDKLSDVFVLEHAALENLCTFFDAQKIESCIISSTVNIPQQLLDDLESIPRVFILEEKTALPFKNQYRTPHTLGKDRLALVAAAVSLHPGKNVLVIGCGTCITFNFKNSGEAFLGGSIHPGLKMRLQAMHTFTGKLPLVALKNPPERVAGTTENALLSGAVNGAAAEIDGMIAEYIKNYEDLTVLITGGDAEMLVGMLKNKIFAVPDLTLVGLNQILKSNA